LTEIGGLENHFLVVGMENEYPIFKTTPTVETKKREEANAGE
jgi:hypothetical protein